MEVVLSISLLELLESHCQARLLYTVYASSKGVLEVITKSLALENAGDKGITVNSIEPGPVETGTSSKDRLIKNCLKKKDCLLTLFCPRCLEKMPGAILDQMRNSTPAEKRLSSVDDVAQVVAFLAEEGSLWVNGNTISATGGMDMF